MAPEAETQRNHKTLLNKNEHVCAQHSYAFDEPHHHTGLAKVAIQGYHFEDRIEMVKQDCPQENRQFAVAFSGNQEMEVADHMVASQNFAGYWTKYCGSD